MGSDPMVKKPFRNTLSRGTLRSLQAHFVRLPSEA